ncbi:MAG: response regulator [Acidobacteriota bacterium]
MEKTVLVVEDDDNLRRMFRVVLEQEGFRVLDAADGLAGLKLALTESPDCIITDSMMPRVGGIRLLRELRVRETLRTPAILVTAAAQVPPDWELQEVGVDRVVTKPFTFDTLLAVLRESLGEME